MRYRYKVYSTHESSVGGFGALASVVEMQLAETEDGQPIWAEVSQLNRVWPAVATIVEIETRITELIAAYDTNQANLELLGRWTEFDPNNPRPT